MGKDCTTSGSPSVFLPAIFSLAIEPSVQNLEVDDASSLIRYTCGVAYPFGKKLPGKRECRRWSISDQIIRTAQ
jgi:hypothetical protein